MLGFQWHVKDDREKRGRKKERMFDPKIEPTKHYLLKRIVFASFVFKQHYMKNERNKIFVKVDEL